MASGCGPALNVSAAAAAIAPPYPYETAYPVFQKPKHVGRALAAASAGKLGRAMAVLAAIREANELACECARWCGEAAKDVVARTSSGSMTLMMTRLATVVGLWYPDSSYL